MAMVVIKWQAILKVHPDHLMNAQQCQVAGNVWTKPTDLGQQSTKVGSCSVYIHYHHFIGIHPRTDCHYIVDRI